MSRPRRVIHPGTPYHFISRFVASEWFIETNHERQRYLQLLGDGLAKSDWRCFSFAIMSNHIHLGLLAGEDTLVSWIRDVHSTFAEWINDRRDRIGAVFVRGPKTLAVRPDGVSTLMAYIHQNPVRAGVVPHPMLSDWTSHAAYVGSAKAPPWLDMQLGLELGGWRDGAELDRWTTMNAVDRKRVEGALRDPPRRVGRPRARLRTDEQLAADAGGGLGACVVTPAESVDTTIISAPAVLASLMMQQDHVDMTREAITPGGLIVPRHLVSAVQPITPREPDTLHGRDTPREPLAPSAPVLRCIVIMHEAGMPLGGADMSERRSGAIDLDVDLQGRGREAFALAHPRQRDGDNTETDRPIAEPVAPERILEGGARFGMRGAPKQRRAIRRTQRAGLSPRRRSRRRRKRGQVHRARDGDQR